MLPALLTTVLFSLSGIAANRTTRILGSVTANFFRILVATCFLGVWAHCFGGGLRGPALPIFLLSGCIGFGVGDLALYQALPRLGSRLSIMMVHCLAAPFAALVEWLWLGTKLTPLQMGCGLVILAGVSIALAPKEHLHLERRTLALGVGFGVVAALSQGLGAVVSRWACEVARQHGEPLLGIHGGITAAYQRIWGGVAVALLSLVFMNRQIPRGVRPDLAGPARTRYISKWVVLNGLSGPGFGVAFYQWALATTPTGIVLPIVALTPLVIIPFARVIDGEKPSLRSILGGAIAVCGVVGLKLGDTLLRR